MSLSLPIEQEGETAARPEDGLLAVPCRSSDFKRKLRRESSLFRSILLDLWVVAGRWSWGGGGVAMTQVLCQIPVKYLNWNHLLEMLFLCISEGRRENLGLALK